MLNFSSILFKFLMPDKILNYTNTVLSIFAYFTHLCMKYTPHFVKALFTWDIFTHNIAIKRYCNKDIFGPWISKGQGKLFKKIGVCFFRAFLGWSLRHVARNYLFISTQYCVPKCLVWTRPNEGTPPPPWDFFEIFYLSQMQLEKVNENNCFIQMTGQWWTCFKFDWV